MSNRFDDAITVHKDGLLLAAGAASAGATIPSDSSGAIPKYIRVTATGQACVRLGKTTATATTASTMVQPADAVVLSTNGTDFIACIQVGTACSVNVVPLENM